MCSLVTVHIPEKVGGRCRVEEMKISSTIKPYSKKPWWEHRWILLCWPEHPTVVGWKPCCLSLGWSAISPPHAHFPTTCPFPGSQFPVLKTSDDELCFLSCLDDSLALETLKLLIQTTLCQHTGFLTPSGFHPQSKRFKMGMFKFLGALFLFLQQILERLFFQGFYRHNIAAFSSE